MRKLKIASKSNKGLLIPDVVVTGPDTIMGGI